MQCHTFLTFSDPRINIALRKPADQTPHVHQKPHQQVNCDAEAATHAYIRSQRSRNNHVVTRSSHWSLRRSCKNWSAPRPAFLATVSRTLATDPGAAAALLQEQRMINKLSLHCKVTRYYHTTTSNITTRQDSNSNREEQLIV